MSEERDPQGGFTLADMKQARLEGVRLGMKAAEKECIECANSWRDLPEDSQCAKDCAAAIRALDPERVAEGKP